MKLKKQIKQKLMDLAYQAEKTLHRLREEYQNESPPSSEKGDGKAQDPGQIRTYYNNSKEERKLH